MRTLLCLFTLTGVLAAQTIMLLMGSSATVASTPAALLNTNTMVAGSGSSASSAMTVNTGGTNVVAFACVAWDAVAGQSVTAITYGGQTMTSAGSSSTNSTGNPFAQAFYLVNPPTGSNTLAITMSGSAGDIYHNLIVFQHVSQSTPIRAGTYQNPANPAFSGGSYTMTVTSSTSDRSFTCLNGGPSGASTTNQTRDSVSTSGGYAAASDHATTAASSVAHTWTGSGTSALAIVGFSIHGE
jgi:hypothetical protein